MIPYTLLYLLLVGLLIISYLNPGVAIRNLFCIGAWGVLTIFSGFRYDVGLDYMSYIEVISNYRHNAGLSWEYAYHIILGFIQLAGFTDQVLFLIMSILTSLCLYKYISYHSRNPLLSTFFFLTLPPLFLSTLNISRQFVAISIFAFALRYVVKKSLLYYSLFVIVAFFFHKSAIFIWPLYFVLNKSPSLRLYALIACGYLLMLQFVLFFARLAHVSTSYLMLTSVKDGIPLTSYAIIVMFIFLLYFSKRLRKVDPNSVIFINLVFLLSLLSITPALIPIPTEIYGRVLFYFFIAAPILLVNISDIFISRNTRALYVVSVTFGATVYYFYTIIGRGAFFRLVPYDFNIYLF